ncbi:MAG: hypothetical protein KY432_11830 [Acidobacteria bacterium]|nr:hypothetical protein [Acidobacteriota bacterium]
MRTIHTFMEDAVKDMKSGAESWRVKSLLVLYGLVGAVINVSIIQALG